jgi:oligopeptide transport system substrate-binding protein
MWKEVLGIDVSLANQEWQVFLVQRSEGLDHVYRSSWIQDYPDANNFPREVFGEGGGAYSEVVDWQSDKFDEIVLAAATEADPVKRQQMYADAEKILVEEESVIAPLYWYTNIAIRQPSVVRVPSITGISHTLDVQRNNQPVRAANQTSAYPRPGCLTGAPIFRAASPVNFQLVQI